MSKKGPYGFIYGSIGMLEILFDADNITEKLGPLNFSIGLVFVHTLNEHVCPIYCNLAVTGPSFWTCSDSSPLDGTVVLQSYNMADCGKFLFVSEVSYRIAGDS